MYIRNENECWLWLGSCDTDGYGTSWWDKKGKRAHRISFLLHKGEIPSDKIIMHSCDNPPCVNPSHLSLGTKKDNAQDRQNKHRNQSNEGTNNGRAKLTEEDVLNIRSIENIFSTDIAKQFNVSPSTISHIRRKKTWKHLP